MYAEILEKGVLLEELIILRTDLTATIEHRASTPGNSGQGTHSRECCGELGDRLHTICAQHTQQRTAGNYDFAKRNAGFQSGCCPVAGCRR